jgi:hypothetical protein
VIRVRVRVGVRVRGLGLRCDGGWTRVGRENRIRVGLELGLTLGLLTDVRSPRAVNM